MKKAGWILVSLVVCWGIYTCNAEASQFSDGLGKTWGYLTSPVNCLANLGVALIQVGGDFVRCVLSNMNPGNLIP